MAPGSCRVSHSSLVKPKGFPMFDAFLSRSLGALALIACVTLAAEPTFAEGQVGTLSCDVSAGVGMILTQKQGLMCRFTPTGGGPISHYSGQITEYGVALGAVEQGHLIWGVIAATDGIAPGALAGTYTGVGVEAAAGVGVGANVLVGGSGRAFSLQPLSVEGEVGINIAGGITTVVLAPAP
jgi:hypothetical protein